MASAILIILVFIAWIIYLIFLNKFKIKLRIPIPKYKNNSEVTQLNKIVEEIEELKYEVYKFTKNNRPDKLSEALDVIQATITYIAEFYTMEEITEALKQHEQKLVSRNTNIIKWINLEVS